ncbi:MAG TPA: T9SS type A sorting domain-containing protein [Bacteroidia bacterium]|nr:T9SS type A sorting domain-containing protein [Bacteroidia bacterium]
MKKLLLIIQTIGAVGLISAQTTSFTLTYNFADVMGPVPCSSIQDPTTLPTITGLTSGSFIALGVNTCPSSNGEFSFAGWGTGATDFDNINFTGSLDITKYFEVMITPQTNYELAFDSIIFMANRNATGPRFWAVRHNINGFASNISAVSTNTLVSVVSTGTDVNAFFWSDDIYITAITQSGFKVFPSLTQVVNPVRFRWYAWNAENTGGIFKIDNVNIYGSATLATGVTKISHTINAHFILSPNPANSSYVQLIPQNIKEINFVEIIDVLGNTIYKNTKIDVSGKIDLNLDNIPAGVYFVRLGSAKNFYLEKLVINK